MKKDWQALGLFVTKYPDKKEAYSYPLTTYPLALSTAQGTLYKPRTKYLFRNYLIDFSAAFAEIPSELNLVMIYDAMAVIRSVPSQPTLVGELGGVEYALRCTLILTSDIVLGAYVLDKNHRYVIWVWSSFPPFWVLDDVIILIKTESFNDFETVLKPLRMMLET